MTEQAASDAALAAQLQAQYDAETRDAADSGDDGATTLACPACTFANTARDSRGRTRRHCTQCGTALHADNGNTTTMTTAVDARPTMVCGVCHTTNRIPDAQADAMLCGACYHQLHRKAASAQQQAAPRSSDDDGERTVQVRCGSCNAVNAVRCRRTVREVQFVCGACETTNEVAIA